MHPWQMVIQPLLWKKNLPPTKVVCSIVEHLLLLWFLPGCPTKATSEQFKTIACAPTFSRIILNNPVLSSRSAVPNLSGLVAQRGVCMYERGWLCLSDGCAHTALFVWAAGASLVPTQRELQAHSTRTRGVADVRTWCFLWPSSKLGVGDPYYRW